MNSADFQADIKSFMETAGDQCADLAFIRCWTAMLHWPPDMSATAPQTDSIKATKGNLRWAERLTMHREIYSKQRGIVKTLVRAARKLHFNARIENCSNTKCCGTQSHKYTRGKRKTFPILYWSASAPQHKTTKAIIPQFRNWTYRNYSISFVLQHPPFLTKVITLSFSFFLLSFDRTVNEIQ